MNIMKDGNNIGIAHALQTNMYQLTAFEIRTCPSPVRAGVDKRNMA